MDMQTNNVSKEYINYHKHSDFSNTRTIDSITKMKHYCERAKELGHTVISTVEHGYQGNVYETNTLVQQYGLKMIVGAEAYFVPDRKEKDRRNFHIIIIAKNKNGYKQLNTIMSEANKTGFYYKPRLDLELLYTLNADDVIVTTACTAGILRNDLENHEEIIQQLHNYFKDNFYLEVQSHVHIDQIKHNEKVLRLSKQFGIKIIHANDSHYIYKEDSIYRDLFLKAKDIHYPEETGYILDYPTYDEIIERYEEQGVLNHSQMFEALNNTLIFKECEDIGLDYEIKLPRISNNPKQEFRDILTKEWIKHRKEIPQEKWQQYLEAIRYETDIVDKTNMHEYFILNYKVIKKGVEDYNGVITRTGRGSGPSFYINKLFGLTNIDRLDSPVTLYPTRFMSIERILGTRSLPDIDSNLAEREPFIRATKDILGEDGVYWLLTYKPLQSSSAFRLWCKAIGLDISEYNEIAKNIDMYREHEYWGEIIEQSKRFVGVIESLSPSPCSFILLDKPVSKEVGIIKVGDEYCANLDGYNCDVYKYLKNDYLQVSVWLIISETCKMIGIPIPTVKELISMLDEQTFSMYELGLTATLNQTDTDFGTQCAKKYKPKTLGELCALVAALRPGFASLLDNFLERKPYTTGVTELDNLLDDSYHYLMYQESIMKFLVWLGMPESQTYDIIKKISKKKFKEHELIELKDTLTKGWINHLSTDEGFATSWKVVEDAAHYSFNASHSLSVALDSLYGAYLKSHYPLEYYTVTLNIYKDDITKTSKLTSELEYFNITLSEPKFGYSKANYFVDKETRTIYKGTGSIKYLNDEVSNQLYDIANAYDFTDFYEVLDEISYTSINSRQLNILISIGYFSKFGKTKKLLAMNEYYKEFNKKTYKTTHKFSSIISSFATRVTDKTISGVDNRALIEYIAQAVPDVDLPPGELIKAQYENMGFTTYKDSSFPKNTCCIIEINSKYTPRIKLYRLHDGKIAEVKVDKRFYSRQPISLYDTIIIDKVYYRHKKKLVEGKWIESDELEQMLEYQVQ